MTDQDKQRLGAANDPVAGSRQLQERNEPAAEGLGPGERIVDDEAVYSAAWLDEWKRDSIEATTGYVPPAAVVRAEENELARRSADIRSFDMARGVRAPKGWRGRR